MCRLHGRVAHDPLKLCRLLTDEQVASVLPGHGGGMEAASGAQLFGDETRSYKCSYDVEVSGSIYFFTIDLTVGPVGVMSYESEREMAQQEGGEISMLLIVPGAHGKVDAVMDLAAAVASALP